MPNLKQKIDGRNKSILQKTTAPPILKACNCRRPADCPIAGNCLRSSLVYQATVTTEDSKSDQTYVGLTETSFKTRFANHKSSFNDPNKRLSTELSKHVWNLKEAKLKFGITWKIFKQTTPFSPVSNRCNLCLWEKYFIICTPELATLNKRNELVTSCRHANKFLLKNFNPLTAEWVLRALIDFTMSNARRFYSSMGKPLDGKGLTKFISSFMVYTLSIV